LIRHWRRQFAFHVEQTLKYLETIFDDMPGHAPQRPGPTIRDRVGIDLDEDLFSPVAPVRRDRAIAAAVDLDDRPWPTLELPVRPGSNPIEKRLADQERELAMRCTQVADLYNLQERQTTELQAAYAEIERANAAFEELQATATQHAMAAAERKKSITALYQENTVLRSKLERALDDTTVLSKQLLTVEALFNDRELIITSALEQADLLKAELAAQAAEQSNLTRSIEQTEQLHQDDRRRNMAIIAELNRKIETLFLDHGVQLKTRDRLAKRCDDLAKVVAALESANQEANAKLATQGEHTTFLETVLRVERETAQARIKELTEELEQERLQRTATDRASSVARGEMAILLRHIARRQASAGEPQTPSSQLNAA
jgi:ribosome-binding protein aMBF1 (putative translation factor)